MPTLEVQHLSKRFGSFQAVDDLSFSIPDGVVFGLLGRNGAGKTTTIRMLMNIYEPDAGTILFRGNPVGQAFRDRVGYLPEERGLNTRLQVLETLLYLAELKGCRGLAVRQKALALLERFDLGGREEHKIQQLSKGNQQKVQFIATILHDPDFIILDEPFSGLDPVNINLFKDIILELKQQGKAIIFSTHLMDFAEKMCDHIALVHRGRLLLGGPLAEVKQQFANHHVTLQYEGSLDCLRGRPYIRQIRDFGQHSGIELSHRDDGQQLLLDLLSHGVRIRRFGTDDMSLHDIFLSQTATPADATLEAAP